MTVVQALRWVQAELAEVSGEDVTADARGLLCHALELSHTQFLLRLGEPVKGRQETLLWELVARRKAGEPTQYIVGSASFLGYDIHCDPRALIPRFDTEILALEAQRVARVESLETALDLCTGSGCLAVTLALFGLKVTACDVSRDALDLARENAERLGARVSFCRGDMFGALPEGEFDMIVSNPPYVKSRDIDELPAEIRAHEPRIALDGGEDGLDFYRRIAGDGPERLRPGGWLLLEIGQGQGEAVTRMLADSFEEIDILPDMQGIGRVIRAGRRK